MKIEGRQAATESFPRIVYEAFSLLEAGPVNDGVHDTLPWPITEFWHDDHGAH